MGDYPQVMVPVDHVEPVPRRIRAVLANHTVLDTTRALYVWEWPYYPPAPPHRGPGRLLQREGRHHP
jgi:hypothetical protein